MTLSIQRRVSKFVRPLSTNPGRFQTRYSHCPLCDGSSLSFAVSVNVGDIALSWDRCADCRLFFQNPPLSAAELRRLYRETQYFKGGAYSDYARYDDARLVQSRKRLDRIERLSKRQGGRLLDVGSASGFFGAVASERGYEVTCVEPDETLAAHGRERYGLDMRGSTFDECDLEEGSFDLVTLWGTDSHFAHPLHSFRRMVRLLRPGGFLAMNYQDFDHPIRWVLPGIKVNWNVMYNFSDRSFAVMTNRVGLSIVDRVATEWQSTTVDHVCRVMRVPVPPFLREVRIRVPAISFRWILARRDRE